MFVEKDWKIIGKHYRIYLSQSEALSLMDVLAAATETPEAQQTIEKRAEKRGRQLLFALRREVLKNNGTMG